MTAEGAPVDRVSDPDEHLWDVVVVGAGAAGLMTALVARRANPHRSVLLIDGAPRAGAKILVSGGGRCNITNHEVTERDFWGGRRTIVRRVLKAFSAADARTFFEALGVSLQEEADGKLFPTTNRARTVRDALVVAAAAAGVQLQLGCRVREVVRDSHRFRLATPMGDISSRRVVLATGGLSLPKTGSDGVGHEIAQRLGHTLVPTTPALVGLQLAPEHAGVHARLSGVTQDVELAVWVDGRIEARVRGPLLWTHAGISGPAALDASRHVLRARAAGRDTRLTASFFPGQTFSDLDAAWQQAAIDTPKATTLSMLARDLPASAAAAVLGHVGIDARADLAHLPRDDRRGLLRSLIEWPLPVTGSQGYQRAEVTAGGVALDEIDPATMASRLCPGLYLVGEILDVDGRLGGFNFQWAWSTAAVGGRAVAAASACVEP
jgi:predicted Rossmann fold flavoprotein